VPSFKATTSYNSHYPLPGENIDCFVKRAPEAAKNDVAEKIINKIDNTSLTSDTEGVVNQQFKLTPGSTQTVQTWRIWTDGEPEAPQGLSFNTSTGLLSGTVPVDKRNVNYKVEIKAFESDTVLIDSRQFNFFPKLAAKGEDVKFVWPMNPKGRVTSSFGPRRPPADGASSVHKAIDISLPGSDLGDILSAADGVVVKAGPARGYGNRVVIEHRDANNKLVATTLYAHMNEFYVTVGQRVSAGQKIAKEGNAGIGSGAHLHFELHRGAFGNPVDPLPYINGNHIVAQNNLPGTEGEPDPASFAEVEVTNSAMTAKESASIKCPAELPGQFGTTQPGALSDQPSSEVTGGQASDQSSTEPPLVPLSSNPTIAQVQQEVLRALNEDPSLNDADKKYMMFCAQIESGFKADASNRASSARGLYQMLDKTANSYYTRIGYPNPTNEQRNDPYLATKAAIEFYKREQKPYYLEFKANGTIANKQLSPEVSARYQNLTQSEFIYGLLHHDGVGNAVKGKDLQGVDYFRRRVRSA
jgi:murein DD-endopeptidase MepM/ murein hydrolase activator NlpD